jgi:hypothetical protein
MSFGMLLKSVRGKISLFHFFHLSWWMVGMLFTKVAQLFEKSHREVYNSEQLRANLKFDQLINKKIQQPMN